MDVKLQLGFTLASIMRVIIPVTDGGVKGVLITDIDHPSPV